MSDFENQLDLKVNVMHEHNWELRNNEVWVTAANEQIQIRKMKTKDIYNVIKYLKKSGDEYDWITAFNAELKRRR